MTEENSWAKPGNWKLLKSECCCVAQGRFGMFLYFPISEKIIEYFVALDDLWLSFSLYIRQNEDFFLISWHFCNSSHYPRNGYEREHFAVFTELIVFLSSYSDILIEREVLMQKYIHLVQIVETEKIAANQLRHQLEDQDTEIERLKSEVCDKVINKF